MTTEGDLVALNRKAITSALEVGNGKTAEMFPSTSLEKTKVLLRKAAEMDAVEITFCSPCEDEVILTKGSNVAKLKLHCPNFEKPQGAYIPIQILDEGTFSLLDEKDSMAVPKDRQWSNLFEFDTNPPALSEEDANKLIEIANRVVLSKEEIETLIEQNQTTGYMEKRDTPR